jgi:hypothetical protein
MEGRQLRMRMVTIEPGGVFGPVHDHDGRPGTVYVLLGTITDHRDGISTDYGPGVGWPEDRNTVHWLENRGRFRRWRSRSMLSCTNRRGGGPNQQLKPDAPRSGRCIFPRVPVGRACHFSTTISDLSSSSQLTGRKRCPSRIIPPRQRVGLCVEAIRAHGVLSSTVLMQQARGASYVWTVLRSEKGRQTTCPVPGRSHVTAFARWCGAFVKAVRRFCSGSLKCDHPS